MYGLCHGHIEAMVLGLGASGCWPELRQGAVKDENYSGTPQGSTDLLRSERDYGMTHSGFYSSARCSLVSETWVFSCK